MTAYRRDLTPGSTWFFTVNLADRRSRLLVEQIDLLRESFRAVMRRHPWRIDAIVVLPGVNCRGNYLRVENTADLTGLKVAARLAKARGLDLEAFFRENARLYVMVVPQQIQEMLLAADMHAPSYLRVNVNAQMVDEFYEAFNVREGDGMYVRPEDRLKTWGK